MQYDLKKLLEDYFVSIPVIQRDYAHGRKDKAYIRRAFITEIKNQLDKDSEVILDFVYGSVEGNKFLPIDGQQRLTTLWLIYWYISFRSGKLSEDKKYLSKFSYETRISSQEFCKKICELTYSPDISDNVVDFIKQQTWFYSSWLQDPTISSMLRTIGGEDDGENDNIATIFNGVNFTEYRNSLLKIKFNLLEISEHRLRANDLYIKMNARGKPLTNYENFKADLCDWLKDETNPEKKELEKNQKKVVSLDVSYSSKFDNDWTDFFWNYVNSKKIDFNKLDDIYFAFINRFVLNNIICLGQLKAEEFLPGKEGNEHKEIKKAFDTLYGSGLNNGSADDSLVRYEGFEVYKNYISIDNLRKLDHIFEKIKTDNVLKVIENIYSNIRDVDNTDSVATNTINFIPSIDNSSDFTRLKNTTLKERIYFLAVTAFIETDSTFDECKFQKWMRVVKNLTENAAVDSLPSMITCMRQIYSLSKEMKENDYEIYEVLKKYSCKDNSSKSKLEQQLQEEKEKAEKILEENSTCGWEEKIIEAERFSFFNGTIRFLYRNSEGKCDWDLFDYKFNNAKKLFNNDKDKNKVNEETINKFFSYFSNFQNIQDLFLFTSIGYHRRNKCWKTDILCSDELKEKVHLFLLNKDSDPQYDDEYKYFLDSKIIRDIVKKQDNYKYRVRWFENVILLHKYWSPTNESVVVYPDRSKKCQLIKKLVDNNKITLLNNEFIGENKYIWGYYVKIKYGDNSYIWVTIKENGKYVDKIYLDKEGVLSKKSLEWNSEDALLDSIEAFNFND